MARQLEVLTYVFMEPSAAEELTFCWNYWRLLHDAMGDVAMNDWEQILLNCPEAQHIAEAGVYLAYSNKWSVDADYQTLAFPGCNVDAIALLPHQQPALPSVHLLDDPVPQSWRQVARTFKGILDLRLSENHHLQPCDHMLEALNFSSCSLSLFVGCIKDSNSIQSLAKVVMPDSDLWIVTEPHVDLMPLQNKHRELRVIVEHTSEGNIAALPTSPHIFLRVKSVAKNQQESLTHTLLGMAPADNRLRSLEVYGCELTEAQLQETLVELQRKNLRTIFRKQIEEGPSRVLTIREKKYALILTDEPPLPPQAEPSRHVSLEHAKSPTSLPVALAVSGENPSVKRTLASSQGHYYMTMYALNVVLPPALRLVMKIVCADKPSEVTYLDYSYTRYKEKKCHGLLSYVSNKSHMMDALNKCDCEELDVRPFDAQPLIELVFLFLSGCSKMYGIDPAIEDAEYKNLVNLMREVRDIRTKWLIGQMENTPEVNGEANRIIDIAIELVREAAKLHRVPDADAVVERAEYACLSLLDKYDDVYIDDDAYAADIVMMENWSQRFLGKVKDEEFKKLRDLGCIEIYESPDHWWVEPLLSIFVSRDHQYKFDETLKNVIFGKLHGVRILLRCRDTKARSFSDVIEQNFPKACSKIGVSSVEYILKYQYPLIFVDAYDEADAMYREVIEEMVYKFHKYPCKIVINHRFVADSLDSSKPLVLPLALKMSKFPKNFKFC
ncbi:uncharacterized protein LOC108666069 isoform X2 [Hyalella azteca]|uniref:Uncharacterized protein LOC108666069 isoform X2 n=1 Tax=Hyalella azteca TaxID=294128 RepID=A0A8B7N3D6_HYAAZ|nr:uncharacterized protein LOC108666069 isoform X2 [Hyalella azteca]